MNTKLSAVLLSGAALLALATPASAMEWDNGETYAKLFGGVILPEDIDANVTPTTAGSLSFNTGWTFGGALGYHINPWLSAEGEVSYLYANTHRFSYLGTDNDVGGHFDSIIGFANLNVHPLCSDPASLFDPYIGAGIGGAGSTLEVSSVGALPISYKESSTNFAAQGTAGFNMNLAPGTKIGAQYRYIWTDTGGNGVDSFKAHSLTAHVAFAF